MDSVSVFSLKSLIDRSSKRVNNSLEDHDILEDWFNALSLTSMNESSFANVDALCEGIGYLSPEFLTPEFLAPGFLPPSGLLLEYWFLTIFNGFSDVSLKVLFIPDFSSSATSESCVILNIVIGLNPLSLLMPLCIFSLLSSSE